MSPSTLKWILGGVGALVATFGGYLGLRALKREPLPAREPGMPAPPPAASGSLKSGALYRTPLDAVEIRGGWVDIGGGVEVTRVPLLDGRQEAKDAGISFARLTYSDAEQVAKRYGARIPTAAELDRARMLAGARILKPCTLVFTADDERRMSTVEYAKRHDGCITTQLDITPLAESSVLINAGKHWASDPVQGQYAGAGHITNHGWYDVDDPSRMIQRKGGHHGPDYTDYSQTTVLARAKKAEAA
jgi:hypothetical protein